MDEPFIAVEWVVENVCVDKYTRHDKERVKRLLVKNPLARERRVFLFQSSKETLDDDSLVSLDDRRVFSDHDERRDIT